MQFESKKRGSVAVIGSGFGGLSVACLLAKKGFDVTVFEKNRTLGGRARTIEKNGFKFDMGPSWYMMPDIFEHFFELMEEKIEDHYKLIKLSPSYKIKIQNSGNEYVFNSGFKDRLDIFEKHEPGSKQKIQNYLRVAKFQYELAKKELLYRNHNSLFEFLKPSVLKEILKLPLFKTTEKMIEDCVSNPDLRHALLFQSVLIGTSPKETPGLYSIMNHIDLNMGIFYPMGGFGKVAESFVNMASKHGVNFVTNTAISKINVIGDYATSIKDEQGNEYNFDYVISDADIEYTDQKLLPEAFQINSEKKWDSKVMSPSAFIMYLGVKDKIPELIHHNLIFSKDWDKNEKDVFKDGGLPLNPSIYISKRSETDNGVAPKNHENVFVLVPIKAGEFFEQSELDDYAEYILGLIEKEMKIPNLKERIVLAKIYCSSDFRHDYNAYKGNMLAGMAQTLSQTVVGRPNNFHPKIKNLFYVGAGTNPGIGIPTTLISAERAYNRILGI